MNRRSFLKKSGLTATAGLTTGVLEQFALMLTEGLFNKAIAQSAGIEPRNYVQFAFPGAPHRIVFDQWLLTNESDRTSRFLPNGQSGTAFTKDGSGNITGTEYKTFVYRNQSVPWMFNFDVATSLGGRRPLTQLLDNMAVIRGFTSGIDGHGFNETRLTYPEPSGISLAGAVSDLSSYPFSGIGVNSPNWFKSKKGLAMTNVSSSGNMLINLRKPFDYSSLSAMTPLTKKAQYEDIINNTTNSLKTLLRGTDLKNQILKTNLDNAEAIIKSATEDLTSVWNTLLTKYTTVINNSVNPNILYPSGMAGLTDLALITPSLTNPSPYRMQSLMKSTVNGAATNAVFIPQAGIDLRNAFTQPINSTDVQTISFMAQYFALTEYILTRGLSKTITNRLSGTPLTNMNFSNHSGTSVSVYQVAPGATITGTEPQFTGYGVSNNDEHDSGAYYSLLSNTCLFRGYSAALLELIDVLKNTTIDGKNLFSETVIQTTGEFARSARFNGSGSDHGYWGQTTSIISGAFTNGPVLTGNILVNDTGPKKNQTSTNYNYKGTWGASCSVQFGSEKQSVSLKHVNASIANVLRISPNPWPFNNRLFNLSGTTLSAITPKNILDESTEV